MKESSLGSKIIRGTLIIVGVSIVAKIASFISEVVLAAYLGTSMEGDAYYMISGIQQVIYPMLSVGIWKIFLPIYKERIAKGESREADVIANKSVTVFTLISLLAAFLVFLFSDVIVHIIAPGFSDETQKLCSQLVQLSSPMYVLITASAVYSAMLQCHNKFFGSQVREVASHIPVIIAAVFLYPVYGVRALAIALVFGGLFRLLVELPFVDWGYRYRPDFEFRDHKLITMLKRLPSALISEGVNQFNTLIDKIMASLLPVGTVSSLNYGNKLMNVFNGLLSSAIATAIYPQIVELIALNKKKELSALMTKIVNIFTLLMIPVALACILFSESIVSVAFERGAFDRNSVTVTAGVFSCYCIGLFFLASNTVLMNVFYGYGDTKTPMYINIINLIVNLTGNLILIQFFGVKGLALATSCASIVAFVIGMLLLRRYVTIDWKRFVITVVKVLAASIAACGVPLLVTERIPMGNISKLLVSAVLGVVIYGILIKLLHVSEMTDLVSLIRKKLQK